MRIERRPGVLTRSGLAGVAPIKVLMKQVFFTVLFLAFTTLTAGAADAARPAIAKEKVVEIQKTLRLVGMEKLMDQMKTQMFTMFRESMTQVPEEYWKRLETKLDMAELMQLIIPLYDKYYTIEDLKALNAFYESAVGQKVLSTLPQITQESMKIGQAWGEEVAKRVEREVQAEFKEKRERRAGQPFNEAASVCGDYGAGGMEARNHGLAAGGPIAIQQCIWTLDQRAESAFNAAVFREC